MPFGAARIRSHRAHLNSPKDEPKHESFLRDQLPKPGWSAKSRPSRPKQKQQRLEKRGRSRRTTPSARPRCRPRPKLARDQELNRQQQEKAEQKARAAQIKQLIETSRLPKLTTEDYYNFVDDKKVKRLSVNKLMRDKLASGSLAIVRHGGGYRSFRAKRH